MTLDIRSDVTSVGDDKIGYNLDQVERMIDVQSEAHCQLGGLKHARSGCVFDRQKGELVVESDKCGKMTTSVDWAVRIA